MVRILARCSRTKIPMAIPNNEYIFMENLRRQSGLAMLVVKIRNMIRSNLSSQSIAAKLFFIAELRQAEPHTHVGKKRKPMS